MKDLRAPNSKGNDQEWEAVLSECLLQKPSEGQDATAGQGIELVASVEEDSRIAIVVRKNITGITVSTLQRSFVFLPTRHVHN